MRTSFRPLELVSDLIPLGLIAALLAIALLAPARADEKASGLRPEAAQIINIGYVNGVAYYTSEEDGYHVVATLSVAGGAPIRVAATLQPEQAVSFSVPGAVETAESVVEIARHGDRLTVSSPVRLVLN
ncbi:hypothetical protein MKI84_10055 [Ancylobacter sp. A5.8]|uniref:hypothetical protein n=1 Tax=Ancylobacter gelatini TaxID=2919920 RepID=UPI001F4D897F|nr:hypothetical protein [Ancylobacter gelatini]MCJ8143259.1 hypothetical protein [Ancylobacter gelatini]